LVVVVVHVLRVRRLLRRLEGSVVRRGHLLCIVPWHPGPQRVRLVLL
jgi:hypothetical protein